MLYTYLYFMSLIFLVLIISLTIVFFIVLFETKKDEKKRLNFLKTKRFLTKYYEYEKKKQQ